MDIPLVVDSAVLQTLKRFSSSFSGIDYREDVFVSSPDDYPYTQSINVLKDLTMAIFAQAK